MQKQPLLILCICFILGVFLQDYFLLKEWVVYIILIISFLLLFLFFVKKFQFHYFSHFWLIFFFFSLGIFAHFLHSKKPNLPHLNEKENIVFKLNKKLNSNEKNRRYEISAWKDKESFQSVLSIPRSEKELDFLHYYKADVYVNKVRKPDYNFQFDYAKYLSRKGIYFQSYLPNSYQKVERNDLTFAEKIRQKRLDVLTKIDNSGLSSKTREFTKGIILADRTEMDSETVQDFSKSGLVHILAISGSHMAIIFWLILLALKPVFPPKLESLQIIISLVLIWVFAVFIDYGSSVVRSCVMISAYYVYVLLQRKTDLLHSMAVAGFAILIFDTHQLFDVGFQLSFLAVFGIFWLNQPILKYLPKPKTQFQKFMQSVFSVSVSAQIATLPLVIYYFHQYSLISIIANLAVIPFSEILIIFSLLMTVLIAFSIQFSWLDWIYDYFVNASLKLIHFFAEVDFAFYKMVPMTLLEVLVSFIIIYFMRFAVMKFSIKSSMQVIYFVLIFLALRILLNFKADKINEVLVHQYFKTKILSVKNEDKVFFIMKENPNPEKIEKYVVEPYLTSKRTKNYELKILPENIKNVRINGKVYDFK